MNGTLELLERTVFILEPSLLTEDFEYQNKKEEYETLYAEFRKRHKGNRALIREIGNLMDAKSLMAEHHAQFRLRLGLQMGMELHEIRLLPIPDMKTRI